MVEFDAEAAAGAKTLCELFCEEDGTVLATCATEGDHEAFEATRLIVAYAGVHECVHGGEKLVHTFLLIEVFDDGRVFTRKFLKALFAAWIWEAAAIEDKAAAITAFVLRQFAMKRKATDVDDKIVGFFCDTKKLFGTKHTFERGYERGQFDGKFDVVQKPTEIF